MVLMVVIKKHIIASGSSKLVGGLNPSEQKIVNWDDYSQYMGNIENVPNHQPDTMIEFQ